MEKELQITAEELMSPEVIINLYLYGQKNLPSKTELASEKFIDRKEEVTVALNANETLEFIKSYGRFSNTSQVKVVKDFFRKSLKEGVYTQEDFAIVKDGELNKPEYQHGYQHMFFQGSDEKEWARRVFILNSQSYVINPAAKFIVTKNGEKYIENLIMMPLQDNFDFESINPIVELGNHLYLKNDIDPYKIGKKVTIKFATSGEINEIYSNQNGYTLLDFNSDKKRYSDEYNKFISPNNIVKQMVNITDELWDAGVTKFIDDEGRVIIYGTNNSETIQGVSTGAKHLYKYYLENADEKGVVIIAGKGGDKILGNAFANDILYSSGSNNKEDNSSDTLKGFSGFDIYYAGDKDIIEDSDGKGEVYFNNIKLTGGTYNENKKAYLSEDKTISYKLNGSTLKVTNLNDNKTLTINNFKKAKDDLGIHLVDGELETYKPISRSFLMRTDGGGPNCAIIDVTLHSSSNNLVLRCLTYYFWYEDTKAFIGEGGEVSYDKYGIFHNGDFSLSDSPIEYSIIKDFFLNYFNEFIEYIKNSNFTFVNIEVANRPNQPNQRLTFYSLDEFIEYRDSEEKLLEKAYDEFVDFVENKFRDEVELNFLNHYYSFYYNYRT